MLRAILFSLLPSRLKIFLLRRRGVEIGRGARLGLGMVIVGPIVRIGDHARLGPFSLIVADRIEIGRHVRFHSLTLMRAGKVTLKDFAKVGSLTIVNGREPFFPRSELSLGVNSYICPLCWIDCGQRVIIGDDVSIGGATHIFTHGSFLPYTEGFPFQTGDVLIGDRVYIPWRVFIMPGTTIGDDVIIGAKALLRGTFPENCMAVGIPAKIIKQPYKVPVTDDERRRRLVEIFDKFVEVAQMLEQPIEVVEKSETRTHIRWKPGQRDGADLFYSADPAEPAPVDGPLLRVFLDETSQPERGSFFNARTRRFRVEERERALGAMVRRLFSYFGIRGMAV
jgi:acetyltransferase-like isoleucine patch superfamily enzyme